jgi:hypothetical protein
MATPHGRPDRGYRVILTGVALVALWLLAMPFSRAIQQTTLNRFHLQTRSFAAWAIQAPVPAMYNFHNRYRIERQPQDATSSTDVRTGTVNHFPIRLYTFGESRGFMFRDKARHMLTAESSYRGQVLKTRWMVVATGAGGFELVDEVVP